jgi:Fe-S-cluster containining protein
MSAPQSSEEIFQRLLQLEAAAREVTANALSVDKSPSVLAGALRRVTKLEDKEIDAIQKRIDERADRGEIANIDCKKGCWFCCTQMVAVTIPEVLRLADHIRATWNEEQRANLDKRMASYMKATEAWHNGDHSRKPRHVCPLLNADEGACSVWPERPIICRGFNSTDHNMCIAKRDDPVNDPAVPQIMGQYYASMYSRTGMRQALKKYELDEQMHEMIPALIIALEIPDAAERYLAGDPIFASAVVPGREIEGA